MQKSYHFEALKLKNLEIRGYSSFQLLNKNI